MFLYFLLFPFSSHFFCPADAQSDDPDSEERAASRLYEEHLLRQALEVTEFLHSEPHSSCCQCVPCSAIMCFFLIPRIFFFPCLPYA